MTYSITHIAECPVANPENEKLPIVQDLRVSFDQKCLCYYLIMDTARKKWEEDGKPSSLYGPYKGKRVFSIPTLPDKLSDVLELAIKDLEEVEKLEDKYRIDMGSWHVANSHCAVCLGGSLIARSGNADPTMILSPDIFDTKTSNKIQAMDHCRVHDFNTALQLFGELNYTKRREVSTAVRECIEFVSYERSPTEFKNNMRIAAKQLREMGY